MGCGASNRERYDTFGHDDKDITEFDFNAEDDTVASWRKTLISSRESGGGGRIIGNTQKSRHAHTGGLECSASSKPPAGEGFPPAFHSPQESAEWWSLRGHIATFLARLDGVHPCDPGYLRTALKAAHWLFSGGDSVSALLVLRAAFEDAVLTHDAKAVDRGELAADSEAIMHTMRDTLAFLTEADDDGDLSWPSWAEEEEQLSCPDVDPSRYVWAKCSKGPECAKFCQVLEGAHRRYDKGDRAGAARSIELVIELEKKKRDASGADPDADSELIIAVLSNVLMSLTNRSDYVLHDAPWPLSAQLEAVKKMDELRRVYWRSELNRAHRLYEDGDRRNAVLALRRLYDGAGIYVEAILRTIRDVIQVLIQEDELLS